MPKGLIYSGKRRDTKNTKPKGLINKVQKIAKVVKHLKALEVMTYDYDYDYNSSFVVTTAGVVFYLHPQIATVIQAVGNMKVYFRNIDLKFHCYCANSSSVPVGNIVSGAYRVILFADMDNTNTNPTLAGSAINANVLCNNVGSANNMQLIFQQVNKSQSKRFKILYDKCFSQNGQQWSGCHEIKRSWKTKLVEYDTRNANVNSASIGQLFLAILPDQMLANSAVATGGAGGGLAFDYTSRLQFETV